MLHLKKALDFMNISWNDDIINKFEKYRDEILKWNEKVNLTAITDPEEFEIKHFVDSVSICGQQAFQDAQTIVDVGTGGGFPGIPIAILFPQKKVVLMDSLNKRIKVLLDIIDTLEIKNVAAIHGRAEDAGKVKEHRESYDLCVSRAVASLEVLAEYCLPLVKRGGYFAAYKTENALLEIENAKRAIYILGGKWTMCKKWMLLMAAV